MCLSESYTMYFDHIHILSTTFLSPVAPSPTHETLCPFFGRSNLDCICLSMYPSIMYGQPPGTTLLKIIDSLLHTSVTYYTSVSARLYAQFSPWQDFVWFELVDAYIYHEFISTTILLYPENNISLQSSNTSSFYHPSFCSFTMILNWQRRGYDEDILFRDDNSTVSNYLHIVKFYINHHLQQKEAALIKVGR